MGKRIQKSLIGGWQMREEVSAGGIVVFGNAILLLRKYNGDWVLPKGKIEPDENIDETAIREVCEEAGVKAKIQKYLGEIRYTFRSTRKENEKISKTVHWFLMTTKNMSCKPQKKEGFIEARFVHMDTVTKLVKYDDEKRIIIRAIKNRK